MSWYRKTEGLLYNRKMFPVRIEALKQQIQEQMERLEPRLIRSYEYRPEQKTGTNNTTESAAVNRMSNDSILWMEREIEKLEKWTKIIDVAMATLDEEEQKLIDLIYNKGWPNEKVYMELSISRSAFFNKKKETVKKLAWNFGFIPNTLI